MVQKLHYLDNASTTKVSPDAAKAVYSAMLENYGNPSSVHHMGIVAENLVLEARKAVAEALTCSPKEVYFTSGGTESNNLALLRGAELLKRKGRHIITTSAEHPSVINTLKRLEEEDFQVTYLPITSECTVSLDSLESAIRPDTIMLSMMHTNNETGAVMPVEAASRIFKSRIPHGIVHCDAVQTFLKSSLSPSGLGVDLLSVSAHKIHGPKGVGAIYIRDGLRLKPLIYGGGQEFGLRSGTEPVPLISGFGVAVREAYNNLSENITIMDRLTKELISGIHDLPGVSLISAGGAIVNIAVPKYPSEVIIRMLESRGIYISGGSACSRGKKSKVLSEMRVPQNLIASSVRISISWTNTSDDIDALLSALREIS